MRPTAPRRPIATATTLGLVLTLTACAAAEQGTTYDHADVDFTQMMIVHHEGALEMAELVVDEAATPEVRALGERIAAAQDPEIRLMSGWLEEWGEEQPGDVDHAGMEHHGMDMEGMDQQEAMAELAGLSGVDVDRRFLELMIAHHEGAVVMAEQQLDDGVNEEAGQLARQIIDDQTAEIAEMQELLQGL